MEIQKNFNVETTMDILTKAISEKSDTFIFLSDDSESEGATIVSINATNTEVIKLFSSLFVTEPSFMDMAQVAMNIAKQNLQAK